MKKTLDYNEHVLVPEHKKLSEAEKKRLLEEKDVSLSKLPTIKMDDPAIVSLDVKKGDIIKILRKSHTAGESLFYRRVI